MRPTRVDAKFDEEVWSVQRVRQLVEELRTELRELEPGVWEAAAAATFAEELARLHNVVGVARTRMTARAAEGGAHIERGFVEVSDWMATMSGSAAATAKTELASVKVAAECSETADALRNGEVSLAQADEVIRVAREVPGVERELLDAASEGSLGAVRDLARARRLASMDRDALYARQHRARSVRTWRDGLGMSCGSWALPPEVGVAFAERLRKEADRIWREAR